MEFHYIRRDQHVQVVHHGHPPATIKIFLACFLFSIWSFYSLNPQKYQLKAILPEDDDDEERVSRIVFFSIIPKTGGQFCNKLLNRRAKSNRHSYRTFDNEAQVGTLYLKALTLIFCNYLLFI